MDAVKGICAVMIMLFHGNIVPGGYEQAAVAVFAAASGYGIGYSIKNKGEGYAHSLIPSRLGKVAVPAFFTVMLYGAITSMDLALPLFYGANYLWFVGVLASLYIVTAVSYRQRAMDKRVVFTIGTVLICIAGWYGLLTPHGLAGWVVINCAVAYTVAMAVSLNSDRLAGDRRFIVLVCAGMLVSVFVMVRCIDVMIALFIFLMTAYKKRYASVAGGGMFLMGLALFFADPLSGARLAFVGLVISAVLLMRPLADLFGRISFEIYLLHWFAIFVAMRYVPGGWYAVAYPLIGIGFAYAFGKAYEWVSKPIYTPKRIEV